MTREGFSTVVGNAFAGMGFPAEAALQTFPQEMFLKGSDLTPVEDNIDKIVDGLTKWEPKMKGKVVVTPPKIVVTGEDYEDAIGNMNNLFLRNLWGDGLPILPPTRERVNWLLTGTDLPPDTLVGGGKILPRGGITSVEMLAVNLAMAGGRPEYLPVLIAAVEAITDPLLAHEAMNTTSASCAPVVIVNGPVVKQIRLNWGYGCLAPSSEFPAGASIGRAIRFLLMNLGGAIPGKGTMSLFGGPGRYTGLVFAEDEDGLPPDWEPLNVERGFRRGSNTLTAHVVDLYGEFWEGAAVTEEETVSNLKSFAKAMAGTPHFPYWHQFRYPAGAPGYLLIGRSTAQGLSKLGWTKEKVKAFLWEHSKIPESEDLRLILEKHVLIRDLAKEDVRYPMPIARIPENIKIVVAGGAQSGHSYWLRVGQYGVSTGAEIKLPANWDQLIKNAEDDLGSAPTAGRG